MPTDTARRNFLRQFGLAVVGSGTATGASWALNKLTTQEKVLDIDQNFLKAAGERRLLLEPEKIIHQFCGAKLGELSFWFQNFWTLHYEPKSLFALDSIAHALLAQPTETKFVDNAHRLRVLPAIARLHGLSSATPDNAEAFRAIIHDTHAEALDRTRNPNREVMEILWQNASAALVRNQDAWQLSVVGQQIINDAEAVCMAFLREEEILLHPAITAWQFLLTYERALAERNAAEELQAVQGALRRVLETREAQRSYWFQKLTALYHGRSGREHMPPQMSEVLIGQTRSTVIEREVSDFFLSVRLQHGYVGLRVLAGDYKTPYTTLARQRLLGKRAYWIVTNYGFTLADWTRLRTAKPARTTQEGLTPEARAHWDNEFGASQRSDAEVDWEAGERPRANTIAALVPFRSHDVQRAAERSYGDNLTIEDIAKLFRRFRHERRDDPMGAAWQEPARAAIAMFASAYSLTPEKGSEVHLSENFSEAILHAQRAAFRHYAEELSSFTRVQDVVPRTLLFDGNVTAVTRIDRDDQSDTNNLARRRMYVSFAEEPLGTARVAPGADHDDVLTAPHTEETQMRMSQAPASAREKEEDEDSDPHPEETLRVVQMGDDLYETMKSELERDHLGKCVVFNVETRERFIGKTFTEASAEFDKKYPNTVSFRRRIGPFNSSE